MKNINKKGYSVLIVLLLVGFIIVLSTGIFRLVLNEMKANKVMGDYIKAYAGAESAQELALLDIKKNGYGYDGIIKNNVNNKSIIISESPSSISKYNINKDVLISYFNDGKVNTYEGEISHLSYDIIPLFFIDDSGTGKTLKENKTIGFELKINSGFSDSLSWNIIGNKGGISGIGTLNSLTIGAEKTLELNQFTYNETTVGDFINKSNTNYLILFNSGNNNISYSISSTGKSYFTKPRIYITSSGEIGEYKQNIKTKVDNTEFLSILKYSIYSGN